MLVLSAVEVEQLCDQLDIPGIIADVLRLHASGQTVLPAEAYLGWTSPQGGRARSLNMPGYIGGHIHAAGSKIINGNPMNVMCGQPRASGITLLFDRETAAITCLMDAAYISALRTATIGVLCARALHSRRRMSLAVFGAGVLGRQHILSLAHDFSIGDVAVFDIDPARADGLVRRLTPTLTGCVLRRADSPADALHGATCVVASTTTTTPYITYNMVEPGAILLNVSLDDFSSDVFENVEKLYVDDIGLIQEDEHRILGKLIRNGTVGLPDQTGGSNQITGTIGQLLQGSVPARAREDEIILVNPFGMAIEDIVVANAVFQCAKEEGVGLNLNLG
jgi:ornithine cyclodeaminase/alanine dehydrogenase-like protein (mu-crystallin family)